MEQKAEEDAKQRQSHAADRVAERYRQLDEEKASKRIVFVDKVVGVKGKRRGGGGMNAWWVGRLPSYSTHPVLGSSA